MLAECHAAECTKGTEHVDQGSFRGWMYSTRTNGSLGAEAMGRDCEGGGW